MATPICCGSRYGTALGIANEAQAHHDGLLALDEVGQEQTLNQLPHPLIRSLTGLEKLQELEKAETGS